MTYQCKSQLIIVNKSTKIHILTITTYFDTLPLVVKRFLNNYWPILLILSVVIIFFARLFFPPSIFVTPDYGRSDFLHFNIPVRMAMADSLKSGHIPFWVNGLGQGFPLLDEGQIGFFYLPNLVLFGLLPFWLAFNLGYVVTFALAALGTYMLARSLSLSKTASYLAAITYAFSPILILRLHHYNFEQTAALFPWALYFINNFFNTKKLQWMLLLALTLSQQVFAGFQQITLYTFIAAISLAFFRVNKQTISKTKKASLLFTVFAFVLISLGMASVQLNQTYNLTQTADRLNAKPSEILTDFPYNPKNVLTILNPYILGNAKDSTYPLWQKGVWGIFWENNTYFGITQLVLILALLVIFRKNIPKQYSKYVYFFIIFGLIGLLLSLGKFAPLHPIFTIPPFSFFRVPSRFLIYLFTSASIISAIALDSLTKSGNKKIRQILIFAIIVATTSDIFISWYNYPAIGKVNNWLKPPEASKYIEPGARIMTIKQYSPWNEIFYKKGWAGQEQNYLFLLNFLGQNSSYIYGQHNALTYAGMQPKRSAITEGIATQVVTAETGEQQLSKSASNLLNLLSADYITSDRELANPKLELVKQITEDSTSVYLYKNSQAQPHTFAVGGYVVGKSVNEITDILGHDDFEPTKTTILEKDIQFESASNWDTKKNTVAITRYDQNNVTLRASLSNDSIIVLTDSYYPGWKAKIDNEEAELLPANINSRAIVVPQGEHIIENYYKPKNANLALTISGVFYALVIFALIKIKSHRNK